MPSTFALEDLQLVRAIGEAGSLTGAARKLAVDHSTAYRRLGAIERRLGTLLFERARDGYSPTLAGETSIATATRILDDLETMERRLAGEDLRPAGMVRVTTTDTLLELTGPVFAELRELHPEITVELIVANSFLTLTRRDADIAIRPVAAAPENLHGCRVAALATAAYAAPSYLARKSSRIELSEHAWIGFEDSLAHLRSAGWLQAHVAEERIVYRANSLMALCAAARAGMGVAALPCYLGDPDAGLRRVAAPLTEMEVSLWLLTHPDLKRVARIRTVLEFLAESLRALRPIIEGHTHQRDRRV